jgi:HD-GYP domain-containing protein (c-di-GMP phosphodiesterase class II)
MNDGRPTDSAPPAADQVQRTRLLLAFRRAARLAGLAILAIGALVLGGWAFGQPSLVSLFPGLPPMDPSTALALALAGLALWLRRARLPTPLVPAAAPLSHLLALATFLAGALALGTYLAGYPLLPFDGPLSSTAAGKPPLTTAVNLTLLGAALLLIAMGREAPIAVGQVLALLATINGARALIGFAASPDEIYLISDRTGIAVQSAAAYIILGVGVLCANPQHGPMGLVSSPGQGGRLFRLLIPPAVLLPLLTGTLTVWGQGQRLFGVGVGVAAQAFVNLLVFWWLARALNRSEAATEREAERAVAALEVAERRMGRLRGLRVIDAAIISQPQHVGAILDVLLEAVRAQLDVDAAAVLLLHEGRNELLYTRSSGLAALPASLRRSDPSYVARALAEMRAMGRRDAPAPSHAAAEGLVDGYAAPLIVEGRVTGVLEVGHRGPLAVDDEWLHYLETLAGQGAIALAQFRLFADLQRANSALVHAYDATLAGWSYALELRDGETLGHTERVTALTMRMARASGITGEELNHIRRGALLHDIGKLGIPDSILLKPGRLTEEEWEVMRRHPTYAYQWLNPIGYLRPAIAIPYSHHEKWDGSGYPQGLRGEEIPLAARLFAVVDVWDALRSARPYHPPWPADAVKSHLRELAGTHFDPHAVELFLAILEAENGGEDGDGGQERVVGW